MSTEEKKVLAAEIGELRSIGLRIEEQRKVNGWSKGELCRQFAGLGSTKTFARIIDDTDDLEEGLQIERQLENYREAWMLIEMAYSPDDVPEPLYEDFADVARARNAVRGALKQTGNLRLIIIEGNPGAGKTAIFKMLEEKWPNHIVRSEVTEIWKDSPMAMLRALLLGIGKREKRKRDIDVKAGATAAEVNMPECGDERTSKLIEQLNETKLILALDEAHHLGPRTLNLVKTLINQTPSVIIMAAIPTLLRRLQMKSHEEARQLTQNRLYQRITLNGPSAGEALEMMRRRGVVWSDKKTANHWGLQLEGLAASKGNWMFVELVTRKLRALYKKQPIDEAKFVKALSEVEKER